MFLEYLQHALHVEAGIGIGEAGHEAKGNNVVLATIDPGSAVFFRSQRPAHGVDYFAFGNPAGWNLPQFLHAYAISLRIAIFIEIEAGNELLGQRTAWAFSKDRDFGLQVITGLEIRFPLVLLVHTLVVGAHSGHAIAIE